MRFANDNFLGSKKILGFANEIVLGLEISCGSLILRFSDCAHLLSQNIKKTYVSLTSVTYNIPYNIIYVYVCLVLRQSLKTKA